METAYNHVDAACIYFVDDPQRYDVIVTDNLFGDILTDTQAVLMSGPGVGFAAYGQFASRAGLPCLSRSNGSAPDIANAGTGKVPDPGLAAILSGAVRCLTILVSYARLADRVRKASVKTPDSLSGSTTEIGDIIAARL